MYLFLVLQSLSTLLTLCLWLHSAMKSCTWIRTRNIPAVYPPYFLPEWKNSSCLSGEYKQYAPVWILITCLSEKGYRNFPLGRMPWRLFFSSHVENFLQMFLSRYCSCNSLWKFTWHKCTTETYFHPSNTLQILFSSNECRMFSCYEAEFKAAWRIGIFFGHLGFQFTTGHS